MSILDLLFPKSCLECSKNGKYICNKCISKVGKGSIYFSDDIFTVFKYQGVVRKAIIKLKYNFATDVAGELAQAAFDNIDLPIKINNPILVPVPLFKKRQNWRGYNQAELIGEKLAKLLNWEYKNDLLIRTSSSTPQMKLSKEKRLRNISGKYAVNKSTVNRLQSTEDSSINHDPLIIVFDDVVTTRATIKECQKVLKKAGFKKVYGLSVCSS